MDLKRFLPKHEKEEPAEYFWSLIVEPGWVSSGIWRITGQTAQVLNSSASYPWELDEELVNASDTALSSAIAGFPEGVDEPSKTVFGVPASWVSDGQIKEEQLEKIKRICSDLSLTPIGFVVIPESISHLLKSEENTPLNAALVAVYKEAFEISVFKLGNLLGSTYVTRSLSIIDDITEGISRFAKNDTVPSRLILYNGKDSELEEMKRSLSNVSWDDVKGITFINTPKVEVFPALRKIDAVSLAGASEVSGIASLGGRDVPNDSEAEPPLPLSEELENVSEVQPSELGFSVNNDVEETVFDQDMNRYEGTDSHYDAHAGEAYGESKPIQKNAFDLKRAFSKFPALFKGSAAQVKKPLLFGILVLLLLVGGAFAAWWYYPKAVVTIYISPRQLDEKIEVSVDPGASSDASSHILAGETIKQTVNGERTRQTTGTKTIGEKAKGQVTLYRVGSPLTLKPGTILTGPGSLKFVLDEEVAIASGSASTPATAKADIIAESIGSEYNLSSNTSFTVGNYSSSDIEAKNEENFSGGSSKEISAVSAEDQKTLESELTDELKEQAKEEIQSALPDTAIFIDDSLSSSIGSKTFTQKVGDEAKNVGLKLSLNTEAVTVERSELLKLAEEAVKEKIPQGYVLREDQVDTSFDFKKKEGNVYKFEVLVSANLLPEIKTDEIVTQIRGKYPSLAQEYLVKEVPGFARAEIILRPKLPGKLGTLPQVRKNIEVEIAAER